MCRWGCAGVNSTFMCKWCGTRYCRECLHGEFAGLMKDSTQCAKCNQKKCQGKKVETVLKQYLIDENKKGGSSSGSRSRSASPAKRSKSAGGSSKKSGTKSKSKSGGNKGGKKKKKKK